MVENFAAKLNEYAELLIKVGMNLQKGQTAIIRPSVDCAEFARMLVENAYKAGARDVIVEWSDTKMDRLRYMYAEDQVFDEVRDYTVAKYAYLESVRAAGGFHARPGCDAWRRSRESYQGTACSGRKDCKLSQATDLWRLAMVRGVLCLSGMVKKGVSGASRGRGCR